MRSLLVFPERDGSGIIARWHIGMTADKTAVVDLLCGAPVFIPTESLGMFVFPQGATACTACLNALLRYLSLMRE